MRLEGLHHITMITGGMIHTLDRGVLFEIATLSPGFAVDEDPERLGEALRLPPQHEHLRAQLERTLVPIVNPRAARRQEQHA